MFYGSDGPDGFFRFLSLKCEHRSRVHQISSQCSFIPLLSLVKKRISCPSRPRCPAGFLIVRPTVPSPSETVREIRIRSAAPGPIDIRQRTSSEVVCRAGTPQLCQQRPSDHDDTDRDGACRRPSENRSCRQPGPSRWQYHGRLAVRVGACWQARGIAPGAAASNCAPRQPGQRSKPCHPDLVGRDATGSSGAGVGGGVIHGAGA